MIVGSRPAGRRERHRASVAHGLADQRRRREGRRHRDRLQPHAPPDRRVVRYRRPRRDLRRHAVSARHSRARTSSVRCSERCRSLAAAFVIGRKRARRSPSGARAEPRGDRGRSMSDRPTLLVQRLDRSFRCRAYRTTVTPVSTCIAAEDRDARARRARRHRDGHRDRDPDGLRRPRRRRGRVWPPASVCRS